MLLKALRDRKGTWRPKRGKDFCDQSHTTGETLGTGTGSPAWPASASFLQFRGLSGFLRAHPPLHEPRTEFIYMLGHVGHMGPVAEGRERRESGAARPRNEPSWKKRTWGGPGGGVGLNGRRGSGPKGGTSVSKGRGIGMPNRERMAGGPDTCSTAGPSAPGQAWVGLSSAPLCRPVPVFSLAAGKRLAGLGQQQAGLCHTLSMLFSSVQWCQPASP